MKHLCAAFLCCLSLFAAAQKKDPYEKLVDSLLRTNQRDKLIPFFEKELRKKPKDENVLRYLGAFYISEQNAEKGEYYYQEALKVNPSCARCYMKLGIVSRIKGEDGKAMERFNQAIQLDPNDAEIYLHRALLREHRRDKFRAIADYNKAIELAPGNSDYYLQRAAYNLRAGYTSLALSDMDKAIELDPHNYQAYRDKAGVLLDQGDNKQALAQMNLAIAADSSVGDLYSARGSVYAVLQDYKSAFRDYERHMQLDSTSYQPYYNRYLDKYRMEDMNGACMDLRKSYTLSRREGRSAEFLKHQETALADHCDSTRASYYYQRGIAYFNLARYREAVYIYSKGMDKFPGNPLALQFRGNAYFALGDHANALKDYYAALADRKGLEAEVRRNPRYMNASQDSVDLYIRGFSSSTRRDIARCEFSLGNSEKALAEITLGLEQLPPEIKEMQKDEYYLIRGTILIALARYQEALSDLNRCIALNPNRSDAYTNRAMAKIAPVVKTRLTGLSLAGTTNSQQARVNLSLPAKKIKHQDASLVSALTDCNKAIELDASFSFAYYVRGFLKKLMDQGDYCFDLLKAVQLGYPADEEVMEGCK